MGQRANYIIINRSKQSIYYNHWRANCITSDLYLGEKRFTEFVKSCKSTNVMLSEVWIEGLVIMNIQQKELHFWTLEPGVDTTTIVYLNELQKKWKNWSINLLYNRMYDAEKILNIDYTSHQEIFEFTSHTTDEIINDRIEDWISAIVVIKTNTKIHITQTGNIGVNSIISFGENIISILLSKPEFELPIEDDNSVACECIIIDTVNKEILINKSEFGLWEQHNISWDGYKFKMGDFGYIGVLKMANISTNHLIMSPAKVQEGFKDLIKQQTDFNPLKTAKLLLQENKNTQFNPDFFDTAKPQKNVFEKIKYAIHKLMK